MSGIYEDVVKNTIREFIHGDGKNVEAHREEVISKYLQDLLTKGQLLKKSGSNINEIEAFIKDKLQDELVKNLLKSSELRDKLYKRSYDRLKALKDEGGSWWDVFTEIYEDVSELNEIFVKLVEETEEVAITSAKQLQELTGINEIYGEWDEKAGETKPYKGKKLTKEEAKEEAYRQIEDAFTKAMYYRYSNTLENMLEAGATYEDLLQIKPSYFNLPETWSGCLAEDQYSSIVWAIGGAFLIGEGGVLRPSLRAISDEIKAPYSVLIDSYKVYNKWKI